MRNRLPRWLPILSLAVAFAGPPAFGADADAILGVWSTAENKSKIEIFKCGARYCGKIISLKEPHYPPDDEQGMGGRPKVDRENPDPGLRGQPLIGLLLMEGFRFSGDNGWEGGLIYDPENGKRYKCKLTLASPDQLNVRGYIGFSLLGRTSVWNR